MGMPAGSADRKSSVVAERRRCGRLRQSGVFTEHGPIVDLSNSGARIFSARPLKGDLVMTIRNDEDLSVVVTARVIWTKKLGFRRHVAGVQFMNVSAAASRQISAIATTSGPKQNRYA